MSVSRDDDHSRSVEEISSSVAGALAVSGAEEEEEVGFLKRLAGLGEVVN